MDLLAGTLDLIVLRLLQGGPTNGWDLTQRIQLLSQDALQVKEGSLYPALYRMERKGWVEAEWGVSELGRRAKFYRLTPKGRRQLTAQAAEWTRFAAAISRVLAPSP